MIRALVALGVIKPQGDMLSIKRAINYFIENIKVRMNATSMCKPGLRQPLPRVPRCACLVARAGNSARALSPSRRPRLSWLQRALPVCSKLTAHPHPHPHALRRHQHTTPR